MKRYILFLAIVMQVVYMQAQSQNWTHYVRTAGHGLNKSNIDATIKDAVDTHLFGIEVDNDIPGRYNSFLDPTEKLQDIRLLAAKAHAIKNHAFVYIAGLECITSHADTAKHTFFKDHPNWVQRDINNRPAMFGGGDAFWISKGDEDVWISPYAKEWRKRYMEQIRQIAATGIDGIYVDIPYWMTHFEGWENTWASFDDYTVQAFKTKTGVDAKKDMTLGDMNDSNFRKWIDFRISTLTDFMAEIDSNAKSTNPNCKTIAEIYPGIGEEAVRVGADVYDLYKIVDVVAHEFSGGHGNASSKNPRDWFTRMIGMYTFRAFAENKPSWMLSYSWTKENKVKPQEPMKNLAMSNVIAGTNHWDARGQVMSGSNDIDTRKRIYKWIKEHEKIFYSRRKPINPVGVYFSPATRNYFANDFMESFQGVMTMLLQGHMEFQIVTPRTLKNFMGKVLILPDVQVVSKEEKELFEKLKLIVNCPGKEYTRQIAKDFDKAAWSGSYQQTDFFRLLQKFKSDIKRDLPIGPYITIEASPFVSTQIASVDGKPHIFLANFAGLKSDSKTVQDPQKNIRITFVGEAGAKAYYLPFLGEKRRLKTNFSHGKVICTVPSLEKGGVVWLEHPIKTAIHP